MFDYTSPGFPLPTIVTNEMVFMDNDGKIIILGRTKLSSDKLTKVNVTQTFQVLEASRNGWNCYVPVLTSNSLFDLCHGLRSHESARRVKRMNRYCVTKCKFY